MKKRAMIPKAIAVPMSGFFMLSEASMAPVESTVVSKNKMTVFMWIFLFDQSKPVPNDLAVNRLKILYLKGGKYLKQEQFGGVSDEINEQESVRRRFISLIATIFVDQIFKDYVSEESNSIHQDIERPPK